MKKLAVLILAILGVTFGTGLAASAADGYPPSASPQMSASTPVVVNGTITVTLSNITPGLSATVSIASTPLAQGEATQAATSTVVIGAAGSASTTLTAPATAGTYRVTASFGSTVLTQNVVVTSSTTATTAAPTTTTTTVKPTNTVPVTGSNTPFTGLAIGLPLLVGGLALLVVSRRRRPISS